MNTTTLRVARLLCLGGLLALVVGCENEPAARSKTSTQADPAVKQPDTTKWTKTQLAPSVYLEVDETKTRRRILVDAMVVLREGEYLLECLLCKKGTKEHESILSTAADARTIHTGLTVCGAKAGKTVRYVEKNDMFIVVPPSGTPVKISIRYQDKQGKTIEANAREWVRNVKKKADLEHDWVFAGSEFYQDPDDKDKPPVYVANADGGFICISNLRSAMLDLPIDSPKPIENRIFAAHTPKIPPLETKVLLILEPILEKKPEEKKDK